MTWGECNTMVATRPDEARYPAPAKTLEVGDVSLRPDERRLVGRRGEITLTPQPFAVAYALMRRPGATIERTALINAMYPDGEEPDDPEGNLRRVVHILRQALSLIDGRTGVQILTEVGIGHVIVGKDS
jgi:DNA-binding response OmpR family regulator